jgi:hypothetical protein
MDHSVVVDASRMRLLVFGGSGYYDLYDDVYALDVSTPSGAWRKLAPSGSKPKPRRGHVAAFDATADRMLVFGGQTYDDLLNDTWALDFSVGGDGEWKPVVLASAPPPRYDASAAWDPDLRRFYVGSGAQYYDVRSDVWLLDVPNGTWSALAPTPAPLRASVAGHWAWDPISARVLRFSGAAYYEVIDGPPQALDTSAGLPGQVTSVPIRGPNPPPVYDGALVCVPLAGSLFMIAGQGYYHLSGSIWALAL